MATKYIVDNVSGQTINGDLVVTSAITASTFYGDGSNLSGITNPSPYKVYSALLTQTSTNNPSVTVLENTFEYEPSVVRDIAGAYRIFVTADTLNFTAFISNYSPNLNIQYRMSRAFSMGIYSTVVETYSSGVLTDGLLSNTPIEIKVYN